MSYRPPNFEAAYNAVVNARKDAEQRVQADQKRKDEATAMAYALAGEGERMTAEVLAQSTEKLRTEAQALAYARAAEGERLVQDILAGARP